SILCTIVTDKASPKDVEIVNYMNAQRYDADDESETLVDAFNRASLYSDELGVLSSTRPVVELGELVWINTESIHALQEQLLTFIRRTQRSQMSQQIERDQAGSADEQTDVITTTGPGWDTRHHFFDGTERTVNWLLLLDALNFCFWAEKDQSRWSIEYKGERLNGYWAEAAALTRAVEEGYALWDAHYLSEISSADLAAIFRGAPSPSKGTGTIDPASMPVQIPLFEQRLANAREVGRVLLERFDGQFARAIEEAQGSAVRLALLLAEHFPSFHDVASFRGQAVRFFKRAQICVADLYGAFGGKRWGAFTSMDQLTIFADYKLPQLLRHAGVLEYHPTLAEHIDRLELLGPGSEEEVQIRAATVWACELLRQSMNAAGYEPATAADIDQQLWLLSQSIVDMRPYHRTYTMYY
ncbi:MAG: queuosine 5'-phosphate N-glycosylase/hydrolase, partial [Ktedonobacteraceae bacterium]